MLITPFRLNQALVLFTSGPGEDGVPINFREPSDAHEVRFLRLTSGTLGLLTVDPVEHSLKGLFERFVLGALVELADEISADFEGVIAEVQGGAAEILPRRYQ